ncbi:hypothetical protein ACET6U_08045 [Aeromonas rivipollensis]
MSSRLLLSFWQESLRSVEEAVERLERLVSSRLLLSFWQESLHSVEEAVERLERLV